MVINGTSFTYHVVSALAGLVALAVAAYLLWWLALIGAGCVLCRVGWWFCGEARRAYRHRVARGEPRGLMTLLRSL